MEKIRTMINGFHLIHHHQSSLLQINIESFVPQILSLTQPACAEASAGRSEDYLQNPQKQAKVKEYENQIDQLIYKLYGLMDDEIKIG